MITFFLGEQIFGIDNPGEAFGLGLLFGTLILMTILYRQRGKG